MQNNSKFKYCFIVLQTFQSTKHVCSFEQQQQQQQQQQQHTRQRVRSVDIDIDILNGNTYVCILLKCRDKNNYRQITTTDSGKCTIDKLYRF